MEQCVIIGGGPAGYTAAIYASRAGLNPVLFEGMQPGGQLTTTTVVENYPGFKDGVEAFTLMSDMRSQALRFGARIESGSVTGVDFSSDVKIIRVGAREIQARTVIVATGASAKYLGLESEKKYRGRGVSVCATCDGFFFRKKDVAVVGGGDSACEEAMYLSGLCRKVYMIVRRNVLRASETMRSRVESAPNIEILYENTPLEVLGDDSGVTGVRLRSNDKGDYTLPLSGFFLAVGTHPNTELFSGVLELDSNGYIVTRNGQKTSVEGVFAAGDVQDPNYRQAIVAAASGCRAAMDAENYLKK